MLIKISEHRWLNTAQITAVDKSRQVGETNIAWFGQSAEYLSDSEMEILELWMEGQAEVALQHRDVTIRMAEIAEAIANR